MNLKVGLEIHQQLATKKLFCNCSSELTEYESPKMERKLRVTKSELGEVDAAATETALKELTYIYDAPYETCLVEADEEPPHELNKEALKIGIMVSKMLHCKIVDELHVMRKLVIDGSNTSGFQRTALLAMNGYLEVGTRKIGITTVCLEEEAARKINEEEGKINYRLDRLGIPLIEIATEATIDSPELARDVALKLGMILRATKKVKRGIGTIREDLNISIKEGARIEIKGVQELALIPEYIRKEVERQLRLIDIKKKIQERNITSISSSIYDLHETLIDCPSKLIQNALKKNHHILGIKLEGFKGLLRGQNGEPLLGPELAQHAKIFGLKGLIHSDELPNYGIDEIYIKKIQETLTLEENDAFLFITGEESKVRKALENIIHRLNQAINGVPEETRNPLENGKTSYSRPLPGRARMYPETDIPCIRITEELLNVELPELPDKKIERFIQKYKLNQEIVQQIIYEDYDELFEELASENVDSTVIARTLLHTIPELRKENIEVPDFGIIKEVLRAWKDGKFAKEGIPVLLKTMIEKKVSVEDAIRLSGLQKEFSDREQLENEILKIVKKNIDVIQRRSKENAFQPLMGEVMKVYRGKVDGKILAELLKKVIAGL